MTLQSPVVLYRDVLKSMGFSDTDGLLSYQTLKTHPASQWTIEGKRVCLPTPEILARETTWETLQAFHPLCESAHLGESKVIQALLAGVQQRLADVIRVCLVGLFGMVMDSTTHASIPPEHADLLHKFSATTPAQAKQISNLLSKIPYKEIVKIYLRRGGTYKGTKYYRVCGVMFPMINAIRSPVDGRVYDVKVDEKSRNLLLRALEYLLPDLDKMDQYSAPSNCDVAPYFQALVHAYRNVMLPLVTFLTNYKDAMPAMMDIPDLSWYTRTVDLSPYNDIIPHLPGNDGETPKVANGNKPVATTGATLLPNQPTQPTAPTPVAAPAVPEPPHSTPAIASGWGAPPLPAVHAAPAASTVVGYPPNAAPIGAVNPNLFAQHAPVAAPFGAPAPQFGGGSHQIVAYVQQNGQNIPIYGDASAPAAVPQVAAQPYHHPHQAPAAKVDWNNTDLGNLGRTAAAPAATGYSNGLTSVTYPTQNNGWNNGGYSI